MTSPPAWIGQGVNRINRDISTGSLKDRRFADLRSQDGNDGPSEDYRQNAEG